MLLNSWLVAFIPRSDDLDGGVDGQVGQLLRLVFARTNGLGVPGNLGMNFLAVADSGRGKGITCLEADLVIAGCGFSCNIQPTKSRRGLTPSRSMNTVSHINLVRLGKTILTQPCETKSHPSFSAAFIIPRAMTGRAKLVPDITLASIRTSGSAGN